MPSIFHKKFKTRTIRSSIPLFALLIFQPASPSLGGPVKGILSTDSGSETYPGSCDGIETSKSIGWNCHLINESQDKYRKQDAEYKNQAHSANSLGGSQISPPYYINKVQDVFYNSRSVQNGSWKNGPIYLAYGGIPDYHLGITENTYDAIFNAYRNGVHAVVINVQADADGIPYALHDDSSARPTRGQYIDYFTNAAYNISSLSGRKTFGNKPVSMRLPGFEYFQYYDANLKVHYYEYHYLEYERTPQCVNGNNILDIYSLYKMVNKGSEQKNFNSLFSCEPTGSMTFVWQPENTRSAISTFQGLIDHSDLAGDSIVKFYPGFWGATNFSIYGKGRYNSGTNIHNQLHFPRGIVKIFKVIVVLPIKSMINRGKESDISDAMSYSTSQICDIAKYNQIMAVEVPAAYSSKWPVFVDKINNWFHSKAGQQCLNNNPEINKSRAVPRIAYGYKFSDLDIHYKNNFISYDWVMTGGNKETSNNEHMRRIGGNIRNSIYLISKYNIAPLYVATPYPIQESIEWFINSEYTYQDFKSNRYPSYDGNIRIGSPSRTFSVSQNAEFGYYNGIPWFFDAMQYTQDAYSSVLFGDNTDTGDQDDIGFP